MFQGSGSCGSESKKLGRLRNKILDPRVRSLETGIVAPQGPIIQNNYIYKELLNNNTTVPYKSKYRVKPGLLPP